MNLILVHLIGLLSALREAIVYYPSSYRNRIINYDCSGLKNIHTEAQVNYTKLSTSQEWKLETNAPIVPCGKKTRELCRYTIPNKRDLSVCKHFRIDGLCWGDFNPISKHAICNDNSCASYPDSQLLDRLFLNYIQESKNLQSFISPNSWLFEYLPNSWPQIPKLIVPHKFLSSKTSRLWGSILTIKVTEMIRSSALLTGTNKPQYVSKSIFIPARSNLGGWIIRFVVRD